MALSSPGRSRGAKYGPMSIQAAPSAPASTKSLGASGGASTRKKALKTMGYGSMAATNVPSTITPPVAPAPPAPAQLPFGVSNQATHQKSQVYGQRDDTLAGLNDEQNQALLGSGYNASFDEAGNLSGLEVDPKNPNSRARLLKRAYDQSQAGATTSYAAQGQLYAGSLQNARNENTFGYQRGSDALQGDLTGVLRDIIRRRLAAKTGATNAATNIDDNAIIQALGGAT